MCVCVCRSDNRCMAYARDRRDDVTIIYAIIVFRRHVECVVVVVVVTVVSESVDDVG